MSLELPMQVYENRLGGRARRERAPISCIFELTPVCNLRCRFCYVALEPYRGPYLSTAQICTILDTIANAGVLYLTLTGGEIFSRRDFAEIYRYALDSGFLVTLFSNATMVTPAIAALLTEHPPFSVEVSIYGADAEHYEQITQIPGSFARFVRGIDLLQSAGVRLSLKTPVSNMTADHLPALIEFARQRRVPYKIDPLIDARHDGGQEPVVYRIEARRVPSVVAYAERLGLPDTELGPGAPRRPSSEVSGIGAPLPECSHTSDSSPEELYRCGAGRTALFIDALGNAAHCVIDRTPSFPLLSMSWEEVWARIGEWVTQPLPVEAPCHGCTLRGGCANCPARSRLATGSPYLKDTYLCDVTHHYHGLEPADHTIPNVSSRPLGACVA